MHLRPLASIVLACCLATGPAAAQQAGGLTGGEKYNIPGWFKQSFLELSEDAAEAAEADRHAMVFVHAPE